MGMIYRVGIMLSFWIPSSVASNFINITRTSQEQSKMEENVMFDSICATN
ncbi:hypothetical protein HanIR_Chr07g0336731 [Helianthus annuus]|nr:hypothetical protein HanIR_Chr07g0336731 [Helianthus annuus]